MMRRKRAAVQAPIPQGHQKTVTAAAGYGVWPAPTL